MKRALFLTLALLAASLPAPTASVDASENGPDTVYFSATGHYLSDDFLDFWREHGGIPTFGYPISQVVEQDGVAVQYFERHVMEHHPDNSDDDQVLLRELGIEAMDDRDLADRWPFDPQEEESADRFFPDTQHNLSPRFADYWETNGGERIFGAPISSQFRHHGTRVQFTEQAILEHHPDNPDGWEYLSERLGSDAAQRDDIDTSSVDNDGDTPEYSADLWQQAEATAAPPALPAQLQIDRLGVQSTFEHLGRTATGNMADPVGWDNVSWFNEGVRPGEVGNAAVAGHLDRPGGAPAAFWNLNQMQIGDRVSVFTEDGEELVFEVTEVEQFHISNAPNSKIFGSSDSRNMNLITCAGSWDTSIGTYDQRLVVYTTLVD